MGGQVEGENRRRRRRAVEEEELEEGELLERCFFCLFVQGHWKPGESTQRTGTGLENHDSAAAKANSSPKPSQLG